MRIKDECDAFLTISFFRGGFDRYCLQNEGNENKTKNFEKMQWFLCKGSNDYGRKKLVGKISDKKLLVITLVSILKADYFAFLSNQKFLDPPLPLTEPIGRRGFLGPRIPGQLRP